MKNGGKNMEFLRNPVTIKQLTVQINRACDCYLSQEYSEKSFKELIVYYAHNHGNKLFKANNFNPTLLNRIGKKRAALLEKTLSGFQIML
jgi:uncharacterized protein (TIGR04540 family)